jgi:SAM-dependent methyltransferase
MIATNDPRIVATLDNLLAPGGRVWVSPTLEAMQCMVLFHERPTTPSGLSTTLRRNSERIRQLSETYIGFNQNRKSFESEPYDESFLDMYLAYYCTANIAKLHLCFLDLVRQGELTGHLKVLDIGVGTGTTLLALIDFLITWMYVCELYGAPCPVQSLTFTGLDRSQDGLAYARRTALALSALLYEQHDPALVPAAQWAHAASWNMHDLNEVCYAITDETLIVASYVINELESSGKHHLESMVSALSAGSIALVLEPGDQHDSTALMHWRHHVLTTHPHLTPIGPCGTSQPPAVAENCLTCWNSRRESLYQPLLYTRFREYAAEQMNDPRPFQNTENDLLSWSYIMLQATADARTLADDLALTTLPSQVQDHRFTVLRSPRKEQGSNCDTPWVEYVHLCPVGLPSVQDLSTRRELPTLQPRLRYGSVVQASGSLRPAKNPGKVWFNTSADTSFARTDENCSIADTFMPIITSAPLGWLASRYQLALSSAQVDLLRLWLKGGLPEQGVAASLLDHTSVLLASLLLPGITLIVTPPQSRALQECNEYILARHDLADLVLTLTDSCNAAADPEQTALATMGSYKCIYLLPAVLDNPVVVTWLTQVHQTIGIRYLAMDSTCSTTEQQQVQQHIQAIDPNPRVIPMEAGFSPLTAAPRSGTPRMIPEKPVLPVDGATPHSKAVALVFKALKDQLDDRFIVQQRMSIHTDPGPDFLVLQRDGRSMLIKVAPVHQKDLGAMYQDSLRLDENPLVQPGQEEQAHLDQFLETITSSCEYGASAAGIPGVVLFPHISATILAQLPDTAFPGMMSWVGGNVLRPDRLVTWIESHLGPPLAPATLTALRSAFAPEARIDNVLVVCDPNQDECGTSTAMTRYILDYDQEWAMKLDLEDTVFEPQSDDLDMLPARLVKGVAGSGKTLILLHRAHLLQRLYPHKRILVLTHNTALIQDMRYRSERLGGEDHGITYHTFFQWCSAHWPRDIARWPNIANDTDPRLQQSLMIAWEQHLADTALTPHMLQREIAWLQDQNIFCLEDYLTDKRKGRGADFRLRQDLREQVYAAYERYEAELERHRIADWGSIPRHVWQFLRDGALAIEPYDAILVDEAQFFAPLWLTILKHTIKPRTGQMFLVADPSQGFLRRGDSWAHMGLNVRGRSVLLLTRSYRNTREILLVATLLYRLREQGVHSDMIKPDVPGMRTGIPPRILAVATEEEEYDRVTDEVTALIAAGVPPRHILVLHTAWHGATTILARLRQAIGSEHVVNPKESNERNAVRVCSLDASTGLEGAIVFLLGFHRFWAQEQTPNLLLDERSDLVRANTRRMYVAITRAGQRLVITYVGSLPPELQRLSALTATWQQEYDYQHTQSAASNHEPGRWHVSTDALAYSPDDQETGRISNSRQSALLSADHEVRT